MRGGMGDKGRKEIMGRGVYASPHATLLTFRHSHSPPSRYLNHFQLNIILLGAYTRPFFANKFSRHFNVFFHGPTAIILLFFLLAIHRQQEESVQGSARLFVGSLVPRSLPLLLFQQSQYLAWIRACLLVVHKFSCRRTMDIFFSFSFFLFVLLEISVVQTFPGNRRRREGLCHSLQPHSSISGRRVKDLNHATHRNQRHTSLACHDGDE